jgi:glycosidase
MHLILDFVPNHTAAEQPWLSCFRANARRDWYVWADPGENGGPPNNGLSRFGGSAWTWERRNRPVLLTLFSGGITFHWFDTARFLS